MQFMPLMFGMFYQFSSGLVLYYLTSNLVGVGQQWFFNRTAGRAGGSAIGGTIKKRTAGR